MIYKTIDEWIEHNPNHIGALPIEVCHQIWGTKGKETSMIEEDDDIQDYKKPWVGLMDEEIDALHTSIKVRLMGTFDTKDIYRVVEQALKEKNT